MTLPVVLTIAGSDSGGGAGIQADIKAMQANGVFATSAITAVTAQNSVAVTDAMDLPISLISSQIKAVLSDYQVAAIKTGMLSTAEIIACVSDELKAYPNIPLVVDPVMISKSGFSLLKADAVQTLVEKLLPQATVCTPNAHEAAKLVGFPITSERDARKAAEQIYQMGPKHVLIKGGHLDEEVDAIDILFDGKDFYAFRSSRIDTPNTHGTGCTYASTIASFLARGYSVKDAVSFSKHYVTEAIKHGLSIGNGHGPTDHFYFLH